MMTPEARNSHLATYSEATDDTQQFDELLNGTSSNGDRQRSQRKRYQLVGAIVCLLLAMTIAGAILTVMFGERQRVILQTNEERLEAVAQGKAEVARTWLGGLRSLAERFAASDYVRLFVYESALARSNEALRQSLAQQHPYLQRVVDEFARTRELKAAALLNGEGEVMAFGGQISPEDRPALKSLFRTLLDEPQSREAMVVGPVRFENEALLFDLVVAVNAPQSTGVGDGGETIGGIVITVEAGPELNGLLRPDLLSRDGERHWLVIDRQDEGDSRIVHTVNGQPALASLEGGMRRLDDRVWISFDGRHVLAAMQEVAGPDWLVVSEIGVDEAFRPLGEFKLAAILIAVISTGLLGFVLLTLWWRQASRYNEGMARQYRTLAERINAHKQLLESVTGALPDLIWLKRMDGAIVWGNKAFDKFGGGRRWQDAEFHESDIFGVPAERLLLQGDERALSENGVRLDERQIVIGGEERFVNVTKSPIRRDDGKANGLVGVVRDVTDMVRQRQRQQKLIRQMVASLTRAVELVDPYLLGHTRRLQDLTCDLAERLDCSQDDRATLELAAGLSQIGKIFVPREILTKPERHSEEETRLMQSHIDYALKVIDDVDFELPVRQTLSQMHERLDGTGYPNGLPAAEIGQLARILAVADVFCARTSPRSYRDVISASEAVELLKTNIDRYDIDVVEALEGLVAEWRDAPNTSARENASLERDPADVSFRA